MGHLSQAPERTASWLGSGDNKWDRLAWSWICRYRSCRPPNAQAAAQQTGIWSFPLKPHVLGHSFCPNWMRVFPPILFNITFHLLMLLQEETMSPLTDFYSNLNLFQSGSSEEPMCLALAWALEKQDKREACLSLAIPLSWM